MSESNIKIAAAYIRVSTDDQLEFSPESQLKKIKEYAKSHDYIIPPEFIFMEEEGRSGRKVNHRPEFLRMIGTAKVKPKQFDAILVWKFSRFARNREDSVVYKSMLRKQCKIDVISVTEDVGDDKMSVLIEALIEAMDEYYSINLSEEVVRGMTEKISRGGVVSVPPFGYKMSSDGIFEIDEEPAKIVKMIYADYDNGMGFREIAMKLNNIGIKTKRGNQWENRTVEYVLRNKVYIGKLTWTPHKKKTRDYDNEDTIIAEGRHEAIIPQQLWDSVQSKIAEDKKLYKKYARHTVPTDFMLKGLVRCGTCGSTLTMSSQNTGLQCHSYAKGKCQVSHYIGINRLNESVINRIKDNINSGLFDINIKRSNKKTSENDLNKKLIQKEKQKLERVKQAYEAGIDTIEEYRENKKRINDTITKLNKNLNLSYQKEASEDNIKKKLIKKMKSAIKTISDADTEEHVKNTVLRSFIDSIVFERTKSGEESIQIFYYV